MADDFTQAARRWAAQSTAEGHAIEEEPGPGLTSAGLGGSSDLARAEAAEARCTELEATLQKYAEHGSALEVSHSGAKVDTTRHTTRFPLPGPARSHERLGAG